MLYNIPATSVDVQENSGHRASSPSSPVLTGSTGNEPGRGTESHVFILQKLQEGGSGDPSPSQPWGLQRNLTEAQNPSLMALTARSQIKVPRREVLDCLGSQSVLLSPPGQEG